MAKELIKVIIFIFQSFILRLVDHVKASFQTNAHCNGPGVLPARQRFSLWSTFFSEGCSALSCFFTKDSLLEEHVQNPRYPRVRLLLLQKICQVIIWNIRDIRRVVSPLQSCDKHHLRRRTGDHYTARQLPVVTEFFFIL